MTNHLFYGDNLAVLREQIKDESVDLVYLDPPFNSQATYNVLFKSPTGTQSQAQIEAFEDTWHWNAHAEQAFDEVMRSGNSDVAEVLRSLRLFLKENDMMAYITMMAVRLIELHRVLKETGSLYLHCDSTASHYLKVVLDAVFGPDNYRSEIIWLRSRNPKGSQHKSIQWGGSTDTILFYSKSGHAQFFIENAKTPSSPAEIELRFPYVDELGRWDDGPMLRSDSMGPRPNLVYDREKAKIGVFITLAEPTKPMLTEAVKAGFYETPYGKFPKLQILTIADLFAGKKPLLPWIDTAAFKKAAVEDTSKQHSLF